ncbi:MAG: DUF4352 domain-containing protein [Nitrosopumilaceae archaeon]|nr:DUF4352 domain-containing protein [Nitrosopumilaceae archaeon]
MAKKFIVAAVLFGIVIGSLGTYYSNYLLDSIGLENLDFPSNQKEESSPEPIDPLPKTLLTNEIQYTLLEVKQTDFGIRGEKPLEGGIFLITKLQIENFGKQEIVVYGKNWSLRDENNRIYTPKTFDVTNEDNENIFSIRIPPGFKIETNIGFEIPVNLDSNRELYVSDKGGVSQPIFLATI